MNLSWKPAKTGGVYLETAIFLLFPMALLSIGSDASAQERVTITPNVGLLHLSRQRSRDIREFHFSSSRRLSLGLRAELPWKASTRVRLQYLYSPRSLTTSFLVDSVPEDPDSRVLTSADLDAHLISVGLAHVFVSDEKRGREVHALAGIGIVVFDPGRSTTFVPNLGPRVSLEGPVIESLPREQETLVDPVLEIGLGFAFPSFGGTKLVGEVVDHMQFCSRDDAEIGSQHYLCPASEILHQWDVSVGVAIPL